MSLKETYNSYKIVVREYIPTMKFNIYTPWIFIIENVTLASNLIQLERFKRERLTKSEDRLFCKDKNDRAEEKQISAIGRVESDNFIKDVKQMLEYNQNGLMHLFIFVFQLSALMITIIEALLYSSYPTTRDANTGQFINPILRVTESIWLMDYVHKFEKGDLLNRLIALLALQFLILRIRAFFVRLETAKINKYSYQKINTVQLDIGQAGEIRYSLSEYIEAPYRLYHHKCYTSTILTGERRLRTIQFNNRLKHLDKIDRFYQYNQIDFNDCFECADYLSDYREKDRSLELSIKNSDSLNLKSKAKGIEVCWFRYIFSINLPGRTNYVPKPEHRVDPFHALSLLVFYLSNFILMVSLIACIFLVIGYVALLEESGSNHTGDPAQINWSKLKQFRLLFGLFTSFTMILILAVNASETALLAYCGYLCLSRSDKVVRLLRREIKVYRSNLSKFTIFNDYYISLTEVEQRCLDHIRPINKDHTTHFLRTDPRDNLGLSKFDPNLLTGMRNSLNHLSHLKYTEDKSEHDDFLKIINVYKNRLDRSKIKCMNENLEYLLDLVEVLQRELEDYKSYFTTFININLTFGIIFHSIFVSMLLKSIGTNSVIMVLGTGSASIFPLLWSLILSSATELSVSKGFNKDNFWCCDSPSELYILYFPRSITKQCIF